MAWLTGTVALLLGAVFFLGSRGGVRAVGVLLWLLALGIFLTGDCAEAPANALAGRRFDAGVTRPARDGGPS